MRICIVLRELCLARSLILRLLCHLTLQLHHIYNCSAIERRSKGIVDRHIPLYLQIEQRCGNRVTMLPTDHYSTIHIGIFGKKECAQCQLEWRNILDNNILVRATALLKAGERRPYIEPLFGNDTDPYFRWRYHNCYKKRVESITPNSPSVVSVKLLQSTNYLLSLTSL